MQGLLRALEACDEVKSATGLTTIEVMEGYCVGDAVTGEEFAAIAGVDDTTAKALYAYYAAENGDHRAAKEDLTGYKVSLIDLFLFLHERVEAGDIELEPDQAALISELFTQLGMVRDQLQSDRHSRLILDLALPAQSEETFAFLDRIHRIAGEYFDGDVVLTGNSVSALGFRDSFASDNMVVGLMSLVLVMVILFFTFRSFGMPLLLILVIQGSIWMNFAIATLKGDYVFFLCYLNVSAIQMGANIDYAIVISSRYMDLKKTLPLKEAMVETLNQAFPTIITSGTMLASAGVAIGLIASNETISAIGVYLGMGTAISIFLVMFVLPQILLLGDLLISKTSFTIDPNIKMTTHVGSMRIDGRVRGQLNGVVDADIHGVFRGEMTALVDMRSVSEYNSPALEDGQRNGGDLV